MKFRLVLDNCPFCNGVAEFDEHDFGEYGHTYGVHCTKCFAQSYQGYGSKRIAALAWNIRTKERD